MGSLIDSTRHPLSAADRDHWVILTSSGDRVHLATEQTTITLIRRRSPGEAPNASSDKPYAVAGFQTLQVSEVGQFEIGGGQDLFEQRHCQHHRGGPCATDGPWWAARLCIA
jgi:hypothetical protein